MTVHKLKTVHPFFQSLWEQKKTFEIRKNDRDFTVDDELHLEEYFPSTDTYGDRCVVAEVTHIVNSEQYPDGIKNGYIVMSIRIKSLELR